MDFQLGKYGNITTHFHGLDMSNKCDSLEASLSTNVDWHRDYLLEIVVNHFMGDLSRNNTDSTNETKGMIGWLVVYLPLWKNMKVSWDDYSQCMEKCSKPPTSWGIGICFTVGDNTGMWWAIFEQLKTMRIYWRCTMGIYRIWVFIIGYHGMYSQELLSGKRLQYANLKMAQSK